MSRAQFRDSVMLRGGSGLITVAPTTATAALYDVGSTSPIGESIYASESGSELLPNPVPVGLDGKLDFWLAGERALDLVVSCPGYPQIRVTVTADAAIVAGSDPFPEYLTPTEGDAAYEPVGTAAAGDTAHTSATDPHPQYLTQAEGDARYVLSTGSAVGVDSELRTYIQTIMATIDPGGPPPPSP